MGIPFATTAIVTDYDCWREGEKVIFLSVLILNRRKQDWEDCNERFLKCRSNTLFGCSGLNLVDFKVSVDLVAQRMRESSDKAKTLFVTAIKKIGAMQWGDEIMEAKVFCAFCWKYLNIFFFS